MEHDLALSNIPDGWYLSTLGEYLDSVGGSIQTGPFGSQLHASDYVKEGIPSVMPKNISVEGINQYDIARISETDAARLSKYRLADGDIIYSRRGDVEKCSLVTERESGWLCGTGCLRIRLGNSSSSVSPEFIHAYLSSPMIREWISRNAIGATMPNLNTGILRDVPFLLPDLSQSEFIGNLWTIINNKITLNRLINQTLEQIAQNLFKSWFVDFDPVVDNAIDEGFFDQDLPISDELLRRAKLRKEVRKSGDFKPLPSTIRQIIPSAFEECVEPSMGLGGWVPRGWGNMAVYSLAEFVNGAAYKAFEPNLLQRGLPILKIAELKAGVTTQTAFSDREMPEKYRINDSDILFSWSGNPDTSIDTFIWTHGEAWLNQHIFKITPPSGLGERSFVLMILKYLKPVFAEIARNKQTTGLGHVTIADLKRLRIIKPEPTILAAWDKIVTPSLNQQFALTKQAQTLAKLRDTLLPRLISGELRLDETGAQFVKEDLG